jgi:hypothetical protein
MDRRINIIIAGWIFYIVGLVGISLAYGQPFATIPNLNTSDIAPSNESSAASWARNDSIPLTTTQDSDAIGQGQPLLDPFENEVIQDDGDNDGFSTCDDPILQIRVQCPVGWELDEEEDSISFNNGSDFYTYIIIERQHIFPIDNTADYMRDFLNSQRENGRVEIIDMSETTINGREAHRAEYTSGGGSFKTIAYFLVDTEEYLGYITRLVSSPEDFDKYIQTFERVASSFEITRSNEGEVEIE